MSTRVNALYIPRHPNSITYKEIDVVRLKEILFAADPQIHKDTIIPCQVVAINHAATGIQTNSGLPVFGWFSEDGKAMNLIQGDVYHFSAYELAKLIYNNSVGCDVRLSDSEYNDGYVSSLVIGQHISAGLRHTTMRSSRHSSVSDYPVNSAALYGNETERYMQLREKYNNRGFVSIKFAIKPLKYHPYFQFLDSPC